MDAAANDVDAQLWANTQMLLHHVVELVELLRDDRVARRIDALQPPKADERLQDRKRIETSGVCRAHLSRSSRAFKATRTTPGFQKWNRNCSSSASTPSSLYVPACAARVSSRAATSGFCTTKSRLPRSSRTCVPTCSTGKCQSASSATARRPT